MSPVVAWAFGMACFGLGFAAARPEVPLWFTCVLAVAVGALTPHKEGADRG